MLNQECSCILRFSNTSDILKYEHFCTQATFGLQWHPLMTNKLTHRQHLKNLNEKNFKSVFFFQVYLKNHQWEFCILNIFISVPSHLSVFYVFFRHLYKIEEQQGIIMVTEHVNEERILTFYCRQLANIEATIIFLLSAI